MTRPTRTYGNGDSWPDVDTEPPAPRVYIHAPRTETVYERRRSWDEQSVPIGTTTRCVICHFAWPCPVAQKENPAP